MIMMDKKKMMSSILGPEEESNGPGAEDPSKAIMKEMIECMHSHDIDGAHAAMKAFIDDHALSKETEE